jgi:hypothetical protein
VGDAGSGYVQARPAPVLEVPALAGLDGLQPHRVGAPLDHAAWHVPDAPLEAELVGALGVEVAASLGRGGGFLRGVRDNCLGREDAPSWSGPRVLG